MGLVCSAPFRGGQTEATRSTALWVPSARYVALFAVTASLLFPFSTGWDVCMFHRMTGLPCPGCGMTRAFVALASGDWSLAVGAHPFVLIVYPAFAVLGALALAPSEWAARVEQRLARHGRAMGRAYRVLLAAFLGFGAARLAVLWALGERFP
jgi:hypothetical protein